MTHAEKKGVKTYFEEPSRKQSLNCKTGYTYRAVDTIFKVERAHF